MKSAGIGDSIVDLDAGERVDERQPPRVQQVPGGQRVVETAPVRPVAEERRLVGVEQVADHRVADRGEVDPELVLPSGFGSSLEHRVVRAALEHAVGGAAGQAFRRHGHADADAAPRRARSARRSLPRRPASGPRPPHDSDRRTRPSLAQLLDGRERGDGLRHQDDAAGEPVEPVREHGPRLRVASGQLRRGVGAKVRAYLLDHGARLDRARGMGRLSRGLVDGHVPRVLEQDDGGRGGRGVERVRVGLVRHRAPPRDRDLVAVAQPGRGGEAPTVQQCLALLDLLPYPGPRQEREGEGEEQVRAQARTVGRDAES